MSTNPELLAAQKEVTRQRILEAGFRVFAERTITPVKMTDVAEAAGIGVATVYRYFGTKTELAVAISTRVWEDYAQSSRRLYPPELLEKTSAREHLSLILDRYLDLYRNHRDILRYNQFFNIYIRSEGIPPDQIASYTRMIDDVAGGFRNMYRKALTDHTVRTDVSAEAMFSAVLHLLLAAATRYAVGLVYDGGADPEQELILLKNMLLREFTQKTDKE